uniref:Uncharacterized protein n=1 Tax=Panagrolaimus sp. JU765 TaxID=591449 RepID=A0AC34Q1Z8_9BILA
MLSLLSLLLASGTVLRADTEEWTPTTYPDPRTNFTSCNTWANSTLCDPDHILTVQWRAEINNNINRQIEKLKNANILYTETAPPECYDNTTESVQIFVILAKRIQTANNQTITNQELINFGDKLAEEFGLTKQACKNYLLLIGVEAAKTAYTRTGKDLKLPEDLMIRIYNQSENVFKEKNYMEGLNKMIDEIGEQMMDPFKTESTLNPSEEDIEFKTIETIIENNINETETELPVTETTTQVHEEKKVISTPWWMFALLTIAIMTAIIALALLGINKFNTLKRLQMQTVIPFPRSDTIKSNVPHDDDSNDKFATITVLRELGISESVVMEKSEISLVDEIDAANISEKHETEVTKKQSESGESNKETNSDVNSIISDCSDQMEHNDDEFQNGVQLNANHLSTDVVITKTCPTSCQSTPKSICTQSTTDSQNDYNENIISAF